MEAEMKIKSDNEIQLKRSEDVLRFYIKEEDGKRTGEYLEFDLCDLDYILKFQELVEQDKKNREYLRNQYAIIDKKQDHKGKKLFSSNEEARIRALNDFFKKQKEVYDMFLGKGGVDKLLNGRKLTIMRLNEIDKIIEKVIYPKLEAEAGNIKEKIISKYSNKKRDDVIE